MKCEEFEKEVIESNDNLGQEALRHLSECESCRRFEAIAFRAQTGGTASVPYELKAFLARQKAARTFWRGLWRFTAVAALLLICALFWLRPDNQTTSSGDTVGTTQGNPFDMEESLALDEMETSWRQNVYAIDSELDSMELNVQLIASGL